MDQSLNFEKDFSIFLKALLYAEYVGDSQTARDLYAALYLIHPNHILVKTAPGYAKLLRLEVDEAIHFFQKMHEKEPTNPIISAFLGLALTAKKDTMNQGVDLLKKTATSSHIEPIVHMSSETSSKAAKKKQNKLIK